MFLLLLLLLLLTFPPGVVLCDRKDDKIQNQPTHSANSDRTLKSSHPLTNSSGCCGVIWNFHCPLNHPQYCALHASPKVCRTDIDTLSYFTQNVTLYRMAHRHLRLIVWHTEIYTPWRSASGVHVSDVILCLECCLHCV